MQAGQAASAGLEGPVASADPGALAGRGAWGHRRCGSSGEAGRGRRRRQARAAWAELVALAVPAVGKPPVVRRAVLAAAPARRRGPPAVLLGGRTSAGREARPWAA